jgi:hypothetical protein
MRKRAKFKTLASEFEMISSRTEDVLVPYGEGRRLIDRLRRVGVMTPGLRRRFQRFNVGLYPAEFAAAHKAGVISEIRPGSNLWVLSDTAYNSVMGLEV